MRTGSCLFVLFWFQLEDKDNLNYVEITELLPTVTEPDSSATFTRLKSIRELILPDLDEYYTYHGSLTTPPCSEVVTWIDFKQSIPLSHSQVMLSSSVVVSLILRRKLLFFDFRIYLSSVQHHCPSNTILLAECALCTFERIWILIFSLQFEGTHKKP